MKAVEKVEAYIADAVKKGAKVVLGGNRAPQGGTFFEPTVLTDVTTDMVIIKEETFGPVAPRSTASRPTDEAVKMANDTKFGLAAYFYSPTLAASGASPRARIQHRRHQRGQHLDRDRAVGRHAGKRHQPSRRSTGARNTASRNSSMSNTSAWAASTARHARPRRRDPGGGRPSIKKAGAI